MAYCRNCGAPIADRAVLCPRCGVAQNSREGDGVDSANIGWGILSFFVPIAGLILFLVWREEKPKTARVCGIGALISACISVVLTIVVVVLYIMLFAAAVTAATTL